MTAPPIYDNPVPPLSTSIMLTLVIDDLMDILIYLTVFEFTYHCRVVPNDDTKEKQCIDFEYKHRKYETTNHQMRDLHVRLGIVKCQPIAVRHNRNCGQTGGVYAGHHDVSDQYIDAK